MWGSARDLQLIRKLEGFPSLKELGKEHRVKSRRGTVFGDKKKLAPYLDGRRMFDEKEFPSKSIISFETDHLPLLWHQSTFAGTR